MSDMHKDVVDNLWGAALQHRIKKVPADTPYEGDTSGAYRFTTEAHTDHDCLFEREGTEYLKMTYEEVDPETQRAFDAMNGGAANDA